MLRPGIVECGGGKRQIQRVGLQKRRLLSHPGPLREHGGDIDKWLAQIDAGDLAAVGRGQKPRGAAESAANIKQRAAPFNFQSFGEPRRRRKPAGMELIQRRKRVPIDRPLTEPRLLERVIDACEQWISSVMVNHGNRLGHARCPMFHEFMQCLDALDIQAISRSLENSSRAMRTSGKAYAEREQKLNSRDWASACRH